MNNEQWKAFCNERMQKIRESKDQDNAKHQEQVKHQDKRKKGKKRNSSNYVQKKKNFNNKNKKLQTKAAEKPTHSGGILYIGRQIANFRKSKIRIFKFNYTNIYFSTPAGNFLVISLLFRLRKTELENDLICLI